MRNSFREREILDIARSSGKVTVEGLAAHFDVTVQTIRRDLTQLANAGRLERVHGGAVLPSGVRNIAYEERSRVNAEAKAAMAQACAAQIPNGSALFINIGTSTEALASALLGHDGLLVVTNNLNVAQILSGNERCDVLLTGGRPRPEDGGLVGPIAMRMVQEFAFDIAVLGCSAVAESGTAYDFAIDEIVVSQTAHAAARETWLLADHSKFQRNAPTRILDFTEVDRLFSDALPEALTQVCRDKATEVTLCP
ncbi:DeoR/GlpR transcriptional regulator [Shimia sp. R11_0]|uniref:DeoR/GlpR family DNA-binding transcription regulator n=1 Tax=Shimia sp. R11_0 TaxID=2821096 RepID=UPI001ADC4082|nr:DeoR/GlpR family DNA-binding transcription regulator [Shimia sp. R11_0]MBO9477851.1 DeoR/GlpR transcriptional regulator [Shimia sp. R11_0]